MPPLAQGGLVVVLSRVQRPAVAPCCPLVESKPLTVCVPHSPAFSAVMMTPLPPTPVHHGRDVSHQLASVHAFTFIRGALVVFTLHREFTRCLLRSYSDFSAFFWVFSWSELPSFIVYIAMCCVCVCVLILSLTPKRETLEGKIWVSGVFVLSILQLRVNSGSQRLMIGWVGGWMDG